METLHEIWDFPIKNTEEITDENSSENISQSKGVSQVEKRLHTSRPPFQLFYMWISSVSRVRTSTLHITMHVAVNWTMITETIYIWSGSLVAGAHTFYFMWRSGVSGVRTIAPVYIMHLFLPTELSSRELLIFFFLIRVKWTKCYIIVELNKYDLGLVKVTQIKINDKF